MLTEFAHAMYVHGIQLKQSKCKWLANSVAQEMAGVASPDMKIRIDAQLGSKVGQISPISHIDVMFSQVSHLEVLGARLDSQAGAEDAIEFALSRGHCHWIMRRKQLCRRRVRLTLRVRRYYATVGLTVLHGLDGVPLTQALLRKVLSFDRRNLRSMLVMRKRGEETWVEYRRRQNRCLRCFMDNAGIMELVARLVGKQHGWAGHVMRLPSHHVVHGWGRTGTLEDWHLKQAVYSQCDPSNKTSWRHGRKGYQVHWEANLAACFGDLWRSQTCDRKMWRSSRIPYIVKTLDALLGENAKPMGLKLPSEVNLTGGGDDDAAPVDNATFGNIFVERRVATAALRHFKGGLQVLFVGDSDVLINALLGDAAVKAPELRRPLKLAHTGLQTLVQSYGIRSPSGYDFAKQVPRSDNSAADAAANMALDGGSFMHFMLGETVCFLAELSECNHDDIGLLFSFDGAARGNPGKSSYGVCGWWGHFKSGSFEPRGMLVKRGCRLGTNTNNFAEAQGLASAVKVCLHLYGSVIEQTSQLAQHIRKDE